MRRLHKATLPEGVPLVLQLRPDAKVLAFAEQNRKLCMWYEQDETDLTDRGFMVFGTGEAIPENLVHRGTALVDRGAFVFHLYEIPVATKEKTR